MLVNINKEAYNILKYFGFAYYENTKTNPETLKKIRQELQDFAITLVNKNLSYTQIIQIPMGIGKTQAFINALKYTDKDIIFAAPTRELAKDIFDRLKEQDISAFLLFGKTPEDCENKNNKNKIRKTLKNHINPQTTICKKCKTLCKYRKNLKKAKKHQIIITTHHLALPLAELRGRYCTVIYDENIETIKIKKISWKYTSKLIKKIENSFDIKLTYTKLFIKKLQEFITKPNELLNEGLIIHKTETDNNFIISPKTFFKKTGLKLLSKQANKEILTNKLHKQSKLQEKNIFIPNAVIEFLSGNLGNATLFVGDEKYIYLSTSINIKHPCIILDATPPVDSIFDKVQIRKFECPINYKITGIPCKLGKTFSEKLKKDKNALRTLDLYLQKASHFIHKGDTILVITKKAICENPSARNLIESYLGSNAIFRNFGGIRGLDKYKNISSCLILFNHNLGWQAERVLALEYLKQYGILSLLDTPELLQLFIDRTILALKYSEISQSAGRLRATLNQKHKPSIVFVAEQEAIAYFLLITNNLPMQWTKQQANAFLNIISLELGILGQREKINNINKLLSIAPDWIKAAWAVLDDSTIATIKDSLDLYLPRC